MTQDRIDDFVLGAKSVVLLLVSAFLALGIGDLLHNGLPPRLPAQDIDRLPAVAVIAVVTAVAVCIVAVAVTYFFIYLGKCIHRLLLWEPIVRFRCDHSWTRTTYATTDSGENIARKVCRHCSWEGKWRPMEESQ